MKNTLFETTTDIDNEPSTSGTQIIQAKAVPKKSLEKRKKVVKKTDYDDSSDEHFMTDMDVGDCPCINCIDLFSHSKPGEFWLRCITCCRWAHMSCADVQNLYL